MNRLSGALSARHAAVTLAVPLFALISSDVSAALAAANVVWMHELETNPNLVGQELVVEGRFSSRVGPNRELLKLHNSKVEFRIPAELDLKLPSETRWVRITGKLEKAGDKLSVRIKSAERITETDSDRYRAVAQRIGPRDARAWNALADRTDGLAKFYGNDTELAALASDARLKGLNAEELVLNADQPAELLMLAGRAETLGVGEDEVRRMRHKSLRWQFESMGTAATTEKWGDLAKRITELLPESQTQLKASDAAIVGQYRNNPLEVYETQKAFRAVCDRQFWIDVVTRSMLAAAEKPDADLMSLTQEARQSAPDHPELARTLIERWATSESGKLAALPAARRARGVRKLADTYRTELGNPDRARAVLREWLDQRRAELGKRDADGRVQLARDYRSDIQDDDVAAKLLIEALAIEPDLPNAAAELQSLGYEKVSEVWVRKSDRVAAGPSRPADGRAKQAELQMTPGQVREILGNPKPEDVVRWATAGRVREQWVFRGPSDVYVTFEFSSSDGLRVISIKTDVRK
jgi:hypothetical protein